MEDVSNVEGNARMTQGYGLTIVGPFSIARYGDDGILLLILYMSSGWKWSALKAAPSSARKLPDDEPLNYQLIVVPTE